MMHSYVAVKVIYTILFICISMQMINNIKYYKTDWRKIFACVFIILIYLCIAFFEVEYNPVYYAIGLCIFILTDIPKKKSDSKMDAKGLI